jgi:hypothetical protein
VLRSVRDFLVGVCDTEVEVEVATERGDVRDTPPHAVLEGSQLIDRITRHCSHGDVVVLEVDNEAVVSVRHGSAARASGEHHVMHDQLRAPSEQVAKRRRALGRLEAVLLVDSHPWKRLPLSS